MRSARITFKARSSMRPTVARSGWSSARVHNGNHETWVSQQTRNPVQPKRYVGLDGRAPCHTDS
ncbi:type III secretion system rspG [Pseudomonas fluorescens WH6]|nr:type III secretion system rspG [Pseudomonas fluorescens WH6]